MFMKILVKIKKCSILVLIQAKAKHYDDSKKLIVGKMNDDTAVVTIKEFVGLKPKIYVGR